LALAKHTMVATGRAVVSEADLPRRPRSFGARLRRGIDLWLPALPLLTLIALALVLPALTLVVGSITDDGGFTLESWERVLTRRGDQAAILTSLALATVVASISTLIGAPLAWLLSRMLPVGRATWLALLTVGGNFGGIGLAFAYFAVLGTVGMVTLALQSVGLDILPPRPSSFAGLVLGYLYTNVPLFVLLTLPAMSALRDEWWEAAQVASANRRQFWRRVGIPVLTPFLVAGWLLIFTWSIGIYGLAYALAGAGAASTTQLITLRIGDILATDVTEAWRANVLAVILMGLAIVSLVAYRLVLRRALRWFT
jgi:putative spermidine/putrescine transport system permease protein